MLMVLVTILSMFAAEANPDALVSGNIVPHTGTGVAGYSGDGIATFAQFNFPSAVARDAAGNLYIADTQNHRIRKISSLGIISTVAGTGVAGSAGDAGPATSAQLNHPSSVTVDGAGNLYIADKDNH